MTEAVLILYLAGTGMSFEPVRVTFPTMEVCQANAERERKRGHKAFCRWRDRPPGLCPICTDLDKPLRVG